ncbi:2-C-methyl-D-erythritol 4-phosphate cytidylyltransferase [Rodentibacter pneumotropicus]|uniref:2-C-methyl-D-erythritol 4-phosphate cytidylyltransferase n=1 Tax=Rodentibacter pneumotropicus TaxID=758 RepID=A0AAW5LDM6_9PAST|nr:IspD/TarI family cytidylyltransferase [Rodentibacter pneumotropicus]MCQ9121682.1 2-C-methyl-D-erythritol 4-phosphate cytidylyltransferase [Rodentibacter pneumotropicus]OOF68575.1 2-C-methyl-D-erythritol 4-phosphate cytidylyltransferase [Rodentibacter pneumotropicus]
MNIAIIFAGGTGQRMENKDIPKQFLKVKNKEIIIHTLDVFQNTINIDIIICVCLASWVDYLKRAIIDNNITKVVSVIPGGINPQQSQYFGLLEANKYSVSENDIVLIHDGVRPLIDEKLINDNIEMVKAKGSAITYTQAIETVVEIEEYNNQIINILDRKKCVMAKAPQSFLLKNIFDAHTKAINDSKLDFIDSASMMHHYGHSLHLVLGDTKNIKVTTPIDYKMLKAIYED